MESMHPIDLVQLNFNATAVQAVNLILAFLIFGIALTIRPADFRHILNQPRAFLIGLLAQFVLMPALTFALTLVLDLPPSVRLGLILIAACPGGNLSNVMAFLARGNAALSIGMTAVSTFAALFFTPLNLLFWGSRRADTAALLARVELDPMSLLQTIFLVLGLPLLMGLIAAHYLPHFAKRAEKPVRLAAFAFFGASIAGAFAANWENFLNFAGLVFLAVFLQNALAYAIGFWSARALRLAHRDARTVAIETGIQNAGLGIVMVFTFFQGIGGMLLVAAGIGAWQIASGFALALYWSWGCK